MMKLKVVGLNRVFNYLENSTKRLCVIGVGVLTTEICILLTITVVNVRQATVKFDE